MGNRKPPQGPTGTHVLAQMDDGYIAVVNAMTSQAEGYLVPKAYSALYWLFYQYAPMVQEEIGCRNPTQEESAEVAKRLVKKLGAHFKECAIEAITEVMEHDDWTPETPWDFDQELLSPAMRKRIPIVLHPEKGAGDVEKDDEDNENSGGDDDIS